MGYQIEREILKRLDRIEVLLNRINTKESQIMATLDDVVAKATALEASVQAAVLELQALAANSADPAKVNAIAAQLQASHDELQAAVDAAKPAA